VLLSMSLYILVSGVSNGEDSADAAVDKEADRLFRLCLEINCPFAARGCLALGGILVFTGLL
jgi:hypothetical protein